MASKVSKALHETATDLHEAGVMSTGTMREFDVLCLPPVKQFTPAQIKRLRNGLNASQAVFAAYLNLTTSTIQKWEQGKKSPNGPSLKLLNIVKQKGLEALVW